MMAKPYSGDEAWESRELIGASESMEELRRQICLMAPFDVSVHIAGESGTGKELVGRALHRKSRRAARAFVAVNCAAIPDGLVEAELFGHARGAFTGADRPRPGLLQEADGGTLFLDEVADLSPRGQTSLLRALQEQEYRRLGESLIRRSDFRVVSASHKDLAEEVAAKRFREDLYFRLKVIRLQLAPLRERRSDILPLARAFLIAKSKKHALPTPELDAIAEDAILGHSWPGNARELENEMTHALLRGQGRRRLGLEHLSPAVKQSAGGSLRSASQELEKRLIEEALLTHRGNRTRAADALGLTRQGLYHKLKRLGLATSRSRTTVRNADKLRTCNVK